ncbi:uncharacterized protein LOC135688933 [Rhopilema esculentum]|uniref:uncharacterized protein LOC135688933 n=1 Tax=Rhopilema esculentum TaxID=499914 RepID=UPI0031DA13D0
MSHGNVSAGLSFHCQSDLTVMICGLSTFCFYVSATAFVFALIPQLHKNSYLKSTKGLSSLWAAGLSTANLVHTFFVFQISSKNIYFKIASIIYCGTSAGLLFQFWLYSKEDVRFKVTLFGTSIVVWLAIISIEIAVPNLRGANKMEWIAIILFSVGLLPQVIRNIFERSTLGQSNISVVLTAVGWSFQFVPVYIFETSTKFKSMVFIGAFIGHINCLQLIWFRKPVIKTRRIEQSAPQYGSNRSQLPDGDEFYSFREHRTSIASSSVQDDVFVDQKSIANASTLKPTVVGTLTGMAAWQICVGVFEVAALVALTGITVFLVGFFWILFAPCLVIFVLVSVTLYRDYAECTSKCCDDAFDDMQYRMFGENNV